MQVIITSSFNLSLTKNVGSLNLNLEKVYHEGNLVIQGNEVFIIENKEFNQSGGHIIIRDNGTLIIRNSIFNFNLNYHEEYQIYVSNNGQIELDSSEIRISKDFIGVTSIYLYDNSSFLMENSKTVYEGKALDMVPLNNSYIRADNSELGTVIGFRFWGEVIEGEIQRIEIFNSNIFKLILYLPENSSATINNMIEGEILGEWRFPGPADENIPYQIELKNVYLEGFGVIPIQNAKVVISNSKFGGIAIEGKTSCEINDSNLKSICLSFHDVPDVPYEVNSIIPGDIDYFDFKSKCDNAPFNLIVRNTKIGHFLIDAWANNLTIKNSHFSAIYFMSTVTIIMDNCIFDEVMLAHFNGIANFVDSVITDSNGEASFYVTFTCDNYKDYHILKSNNLGIEIPFNMSTSTPIILNGLGKFDVINPPNGTINQKRSIKLDWEDSQGATFYDLHFGNELPPPLLASNLNESEYQVDNLDPNKYYYWQVISKHSCGKELKGPFWYFHTSDCQLPSIPENPSPPDGAVDISVEDDLYWDDSANAASYDVYFGTTSPPPNIGIATRSSYDLGKLNYETMHDDINYCA